jgi:Domain of unknown function (DUF397)
VNDWRKSSFSANDGECVEIGTSWRTSAYSGSDGNCVEAGATASCVCIRDTKQDGEGPVLHIPASAWREFIAEVRVP